MKTAISIPDDVFQRAEDLAKELSMSRSQLYSEAIHEYVDRHDPATLTQRIDEVCERTGGPADEFSQRAALSILRDSEW